VQDLQQQELTLLQLQMNAKSQEFVAAWQSVQDDLSREADERAVVEGQLAAVQQQVRHANQAAMLFMPHQHRCQGCPQVHGPAR
jgi:hypothetical protein